VKRCLRTEIQIKSELKKFLVEVYRFHVDGDIKGRTVLWKPRVGDHLEG
jgi:hypothetical protein